jgi:predicted XRE-type DNA-binding protein
MFCTASRKSNQRSNNVCADIGMPQPKLSRMLRGQFRGIGEARMLDCLNRLGRDVEIVLRKASRTKGAVPGRSMVMFA